MSKSSKIKPSNKKQEIALPVESINKTSGISYWISLSIILLISGLIRLQYLDIPLERDESLYAYIGKLALSGGKPYIDFYEMKPPGLFYSYALLVGLFGYSQTGIHISALVVALLNTLFTFLIAKKIGDTRLAILATITYSVWSLCPGFYSTSLESENIALCWGMPALLLALNYPDLKNTKQLFVIGLLLSMAFLVKQTAGFMAIVVALYWLTQWFKSRSSTFLDFLKPLFWTIIGFLIPITLTAIGIWAIGSWEEAIFWLVEYPKMYTSKNTMENIGLVLNNLKILILKDYYGYFIVSILGLVTVILSKRTWAEKVFLVSWAILGTVVVAIGLRFYGHYWLTVLPALALLGAIFFNTIIHWLKQTKGSIEANGVLIIAVLWSIHAFFIQPNYYFNPSVKEISHSFSPGNPFPEHQQLSEYLQRIIKPTDRLMVFGSDPQYFIYLNKTSPIRHVYMPFFASRDYPRALKWQQETVEGLKSTSPEYVVFNNYAMAWMYKPSENAQMYAQIYNYLSLQYDIVAFIENPGKTTLSSIKIQEPTSTKKGPSTDIYIVVYKRR